MRRLDRVWTAIDRHPARTDAIVAAIFLALALLNLHVSWRFSQPMRWEYATALTVAAIAPLAWRRRFPLLVLAIMAPLSIVAQVLEIPEYVWTINATWVAFFSAGAYGRAPRRDWVRAAALAVVAGWVCYSLFIDDPPPDIGDPTLVQVLSLLANTVVLGWIWWLGDMARVGRQREIQLAERTRELEREQAVNAARAVLDERVRIARELHDVVAHHVSVMGVQAGAARRVLARQPDRAEEALAAIESASRQAVVELHRLLGLLRQGTDDGDLAPQPQMGQLATLVGQMRDAGLPVELTIEGEQRPLPPSVELSAYRIVQEALTNTLKHAGPATATVTVRYGEGAVDIDVRDDGTVAAPAPNGRGNGLLGMRERVGLLGGSLQIEHQPGAGFLVRAHLPIHGRPT
jgi:signal transduction histidine kinase